jgi:hypothetical protein
VLSARDIAACGKGGAEQAQQLCDALCQRLTYASAMFEKVWGQGCTAPS